MTALKNVNRKATSQRESAHPSQIVNHEGGYVFTTSDVTRLERFLILGTDGGSYYVKERAFTKESVEFLVKLIQKDEALVRSTLVNVSINGRAYKNSPAIFTLALLFTDGKDKAASRAVFNQVVRTSTHLFEFAQYIENLGGWGRAKRNAVAEWYTSKTNDQLAYQIVKYRQRNGWTHKDTLRLSHPVGLNEGVVSVALGKQPKSDLYVPEIVDGFKRIQRATTIKGVLNALDEYPNLPWETVPTKFLTRAEVWKKIFYNNQLNGQALLRNVVRLAKLKAFDDSTFAIDYASKLTDAEMVKRTRLHPINYLNALITYDRGQLEHDSYLADRHREWDRIALIVDALDAGFYESFKYVKPANRRTLIGVDVSGSMTQKALGTDLTCAEVAAAMAMTIARTEPVYYINGFSDQFVDLGITARSSLNDALKKVQRQNFGGTDCVVPMKYAINHHIEIDTFVVITDNETWGGRMHPHRGIVRYRRQSGIDAKLIVLGTASNDFTIADPKDQGMLDVCGFDANVPKIVADFSAGRV